MASSPNSHLKIQLDSKSIVLCGSPEQSTGRLLKGNVTLHLRAPMRVKSIKLRLFGQMRLQWRENTVKRTLVDHEWVFLGPPKHGTHTIEEGTHTYPFEIPLPGDLPETTEDNPYAQVLYKLKAVAVRPALASKLIDREVVHIYRRPDPAGHERSIRVAGNHEGILAYELECRRRMFRRGDRVPVKVHLWPDVPGEWAVRYISCVFKEITAFEDISSHGSNNNRIMETRILRFSRDEDFPCIETHCQKTLPIPVPRYAKFDATNSLFCIEHKLHFTIALVNNNDGRLSEFRTALPITVVHEDLIEAQRLADGDLLPSYEDARRSAPYIPEMVSHVDSPQHSPVSTPTDELEDWLVMPAPCALAQPPLYSLPSYEATIALPAYDTLIR
ncbi:hypothetical protein BJV82DRAFT_652566 [Fennellomyces sp. T-0311]|nr:hypothetical protein BJV82DRAFT_652566 [Fennellomyces sp. T-0311]